MIRQLSPDPPLDLLTEPIIATFHFDSPISVAALHRVFEIVGMEPSATRASVNVGGLRGRADMPGQKALEMLESGESGSVGFSLDTAVNEVPSVSLGPWRDGGALRLMIWNRRWSHEIFSLLRTSFDSVIEGLGPYRGIMGLEAMGRIAKRVIGSPKGLFDRMPVTRYDWYQAYSPGDFIDTSVKGADIARLGGCIRIASGLTPIAPLAARDAVRSAVLAGLPYDAEVVPDQPGAMPLWHTALLATADGGVELSDDLRGLVAGRGNVG